MYHVPKRVTLRIGIRKCDLPRFKLEIELIQVWNWYTFGANYLAKFSNVCTLHDVLGEVKHDKRADVKHKRDGMGQHNIKPLPDCPTKLIVASSNVTCATLDECTMVDNYEI